MNSDPSTNLVVFEIKGIREPFIVQRPTEDVHCVEQAWWAAPVDHRKAARKVTRIYSEWQPSKDDIAFIEQTFPKAQLTFSFRRPVTPDGWTAAYVAAREKMKAAADERAAKQAAQNMKHVSATGELLPVLWSRTSLRSAMLEYVPHWDVVPGHLHVALATVAITPTGTVGMNHLTRASLGDRPFEEVFRGAAGSLAKGLRINSHRDAGRPDRGDLLVLQRDGVLASSAVALPDFHRQMAHVLGHDDLVVGLPDPDTVLVARSDSGWADEVRQTVLTSAGQASELVPCVLAYGAAGVRMLDERPEPA